MAVFPFTVRATDSEGSYSDRQFNITVRNSRVERFMVINSTNAYTSPDGSSWTVRAGQGGITCEYGNGFWLIVKDGNFNLIKSTDGINYNAIAPANMTFLDELGAATTAPVVATTCRLKFFNGKFYIVAPSGAYFYIWTSTDGITWNRFTLMRGVNTSQAFTNTQNIFTKYEYGVDGDTLFIPYPVMSTNITAGYSPALGWSTKDGVTFTPIKNIANTTAGNQGCCYLSRVNGMYFAQGATHANTTLDGRNYLYSSDGINWTVATYHSRITASYSGSDTLAFSNTKIFYANGQLYLFAGKYLNSTGPMYYYTSLDGLTWTENSYKRFNNNSTYMWPNVLYKNGIYLIAPSSGAGSDTSTDATLPNSQGRISIDGATWNISGLIDSPGATTYNFNDVAAM